jgi:hypothetical protein
VFAVTLDGVWIGNGIYWSLWYMKLVTKTDRGCHVVSVTNPHGRSLGFLDWSPYFFFQVALQLWSSGQSSWLQIQRSGFDSRRYHISW